ncbi:MAG: FAD:protein FMN transferase [Candidatus Taylorbacteria bacterium]
MSDHHIIFTAIGTSWDIHILEYTTDSIVHLEKIVKKRISSFDHTYSRFNPDSLVTRISKQAGVFEFPEDAEELFSLYRKLYDVTGGKVTPLIGDVLVGAGYDMSYSLQAKKHISPAHSWDSVMHYAHPRLTTTRPIQLDFGALGKGYIIDIVGSILEEHGVDSYTINAGGDIRYQNKERATLRVGLENPLNAQEIVGTADIVNKSICGSSGNRRAWSTFTHIMDPHSSTSPVHIRALWTVASNTLTADGLATALFFIEPHVLREHIDFEYAILYSDGSAQRSPHFPGIFFHE